MAANKQPMVTAVFRDRFNAERAFDLLRERGFQDSEINVLMSDRARANYYGDPKKDKLAVGSHIGEGTAVGGAVGTAVGAGLAAVAAIGTTLAIPGLGMIIAGPIAAAIMGAGAGAVTGGVLGALVGWGIPAANARAYEEALRDGGVVIGVVPRSTKEANEIEHDFQEVQGENVVRAGT